MSLTDRFLEHPSVYTAWQRPFVKMKFAPVERFLRSHDVRRVLDVGCGPGTNAPRFVGADYVGVDINDQYLRRARTKSTGRFIQADLGTADLSALGIFDMILVNSFLHHLADDEVNRLLKQLHHLLAPNGFVHILELVLPDQYSISRLMAKLDRGRFARRQAVWENLFTEYFEAVAVEPYDIAGLWAMVYFQGKKKNHAAVSRHSPI